MLFYTQTAKFERQAIFTHKAQRLGACGSHIPSLTTQAETSVYLSMRTLFMSRHGDLVLTEAQTCNNNK